jgi:hypothetical protein
MKNDTCVICLKNFEPRQGKLYCSDACKQQAYQSRQEEASSVEKKTDLLEERVSIKKPKYRFNHTEYNEYIKRYPDTHINNMYRYFFFRKNLSGQLKFDEVMIYFQDFIDNGFFDRIYYDRDSIEELSLDEFTRLFYTDEVEVHFSPCEVT